MMDNLLRHELRRIMIDFAAATGLQPLGPAPSRYLWTDAFAVANYLELYRLEGREEELNLARRLVEQVHRVLGRHRPDDHRRGWLSGLSEEEGGRHPTAGGLRIGKPLPERSPSESLDQELEWERDGQYYHYLVKWLHTLNLIGRVTGEACYNQWARELARTMHSRFLRPPYPGGPVQICWKMSIDLSRPLVAGMGQHDALDGLLAYRSLEAGPAGTPGLRREIAELAELCRNGQWGTDDPLGLGGLLCDALQAGDLLGRGVTGPGQLLPALLRQAGPGLAAFIRRGDLRLPANERLAFRELGLSLGLRAAAKLQTLVEGQPEIFPPALRLREPLAQILAYVPFAAAIENFWLDPAHQAAASWRAHYQINQVMLVTSLAPDTFLGS
jgi:hypothetical protein